MTSGSEGQAEIEGPAQICCAPHQALFNRRFPMLAGVELEHSWAGFVCLSRNSAPGFGQVADNVWCAICQSAVGFTKGTVGGMLAADMASGRTIG